MPSLPPCKKETLPGYSERQEAMTREYLQGCESAGIKPDASYRIEPQNFEGAGERDQCHFENGEPVQIVMPPTEAPPSDDREEFARIILGMAEWVHEKELSVKWTAVMVALGQERRPYDEIAKTLGCTPRLVQLRVAEARAVLAELRGEATK